MLVGEIVADRFAILRVIAKGGMGIVFLAHDRATDQNVALKVLSDQSPVSRERFERESKLLSTLRHPRIVRYITHGITSTGECYLVEQWIDGETLRSHMVNTGFTAQQSVTLTCHVAEALSEAHALGIVHRDVKPENLLLEHGEIARLTVVDFGIARHLHSLEHLTRTGAMIGTPGYMAPEQALGSRAIDARADVFALGCILYECLSGHQRICRLQPPGGARQGSEFSTDATLRVLPRSPRGAGSPGFPLDRQRSC